MTTEQPDIAAIEDTARIELERVEQVRIIEAMMDPGAGVLVDGSAITSCLADAITAELPAAGAPQLPKTLPPTPKPPVSPAPPLSRNPADTVDDVYDEVKDEAGASIWSDTPTFDDQYARYRDTCRVVGPQMAVYNITDPTQLNQLNLMLGKQSPHDAPGIILLDKKENCHEGKWLVLLEYLRVEYKKLLTTT